MVLHRRTGPAACRNFAGRLSVDDCHWPDGPRQARPASDRLDTCRDANLLGPAVDRCLARAMAALAQSLPLGKDRARTDAKPRSGGIAACAGKSDEDATAPTSK